MITAKGNTWEETDEFSYTEKKKSHLGNFLKSVFYSKSNPDKKLQINWASSDNKDVPQVNKSTPKP